MAIPNEAKAANEIYNSAVTGAKDGQCALACSGEKRKY